MRPIKFRFFDTYTSIMIPWEDVKHTGLELESCFEMTSMKVMQFTGLTDKNGTGIYEGDVIVITYHGTNSVSKYKPKDVRWDSEKCGFNVSNGVDCEVIGNIYQSPELLESV